jgi:hypothetical protein
MHVRISTIASLIATLALGAVACDDNSLNDAPPRLLTRPTPVHLRRASVQPGRISPEFFSDRTCRGHRPFRTRFNLFVHSDREFKLGRLGFEFRDHAGGRAAPVPIPTTVTGPTIPNSIPVPLPTSAPIPIPGSLPFHGVMFSSGIHGLGIVLEFDCGVSAEGTLSIGVETADTDGTPDVLRVSVPVASQ